MRVTEDLRWVFLWSGVLCILPMYKNREFHKQTILAYAISVVFVALYVYSIIFKFQGSRNSGVIMDGILMTAMTLTNVSTLIGAAHWNYEPIKEIINSFNMSYNLNQKDVRLNHVVIKFILLNAFLILLIAYHFYTWMEGQNYLEYRYRVIEMIQMYYSTLTVYTEFLLLSHILKRFELYNNVQENYDYLKVALQNSYQQTDMLTNLHNILCDICDYFNEIYGWQVLMTIFNIVFNILNMIDFMLNNDERQSKNHLIFIIIITLFYCAQGVVIATKCEQIANEGKRTVTLAYKALHRYSSIQNLRDKLFILAQQASARSPQFTAAGFFPVDYSMLFTFVNLITTYVIVIIQFSASPGSQPKVPVLNCTAASTN